MKSVSAVFLVLVLAAAGARGNDYLPGPTRFQVCENKNGAGFFWVETDTGKVWWAEPEKMAWVFWGAPEGGRPGPVGTYVPYANKSGDGLFVLNTGSGEGSWTNGKEWKKLGKPEGRERRGDRYPEPAR